MLIVHAKYTTIHVRGWRKRIKAAWLLLRQGSFVMMDTTTTCNGPRQSEDSLRANLSSVSP